MPDSFSFFRDVLGNLVDRGTSEYVIDHAIRSSPNVQNPNNPFAQPPGLWEVTETYTGYDSGTGTTILPFIVGVSLVGGPDVVMDE